MGPTGAASKPRARGRYTVTPRKPASSRISRDSGNVTAAARTRAHPDPEVVQEPEVGAAPEKFSRRNLTLRRRSFVKVSSTKSITARRLLTPSARRLPRSRVHRHDLARRMRRGRLDRPRRGSTATARARRSRVPPRSVPSPSPAAARSPSRQAATSPRRHPKRQSSPPLRAQGPVHQSVRRHAGGD